MDLCLRLPAALLGLALLGTGCIRLEFKPGDLITDTVDAGKGLYTTIKRKRNGQEARLYEHTLPVAAGQSDAETASACFDYLQEVITLTTDGRAEFEGQSTEIVELDPGRGLRCTITAVVTPRA